METVIVIPSLEPDERLLPYVKDLQDAGYQMVVVDDGSGEKYQRIFADIAALENVAVLHHEKNRGKGCALKTAYAYIEKSLPDAKWIITADADGQHTKEDVQKVEKAMKDGLKGLVLGSRDFKLSHVPKKSRYGNAITSFVFWLLYGVHCPDTQTGLRGFERKWLRKMQEIKGERFEYEMTVLIDLSREKVPLPAVTIETVYENDNKGTHFDPIKDSIRIYKVIFGNFVKFISSSMLSTGIDMGLAFVLLYVLNKMGVQPTWVRIFISTAVARIVSATTNFLLNKNFVFHLKASGARTIHRYILLCIAIWALSSGASALINHVLHISEYILLPIVNIALFFISYRLQRNWVFNEKEMEK
jgi:Glycosyltransferases involved in cell wall biogenesis